MLDARHCTPQYYTVEVVYTNYNIYGREWGSSVASLRRCVVASCLLIYRHTVEYSYGRSRNGSASPRSTSAAPVQPKANTPPTRAPLPRLELDQFHAIYVVVHVLVVRALDAASARRFASGLGVGSAPSQVLPWCIDITHSLTKQRVAQVRSPLACIHFTSPSLSHHTAVISTTPRREAASHLLSPHRPSLSHSHLNFCNPLVPPSLPIHPSLSLNPSLHLLRVQPNPS
jgi:hypothetical protein